MTPSPAAAPAPLAEAGDADRAEVASWRQGDVFGLGRHLALMPDGGSATAAVVADFATEALVLVGQSCDVVKPIDRRPITTMAPLVRLADDELREARAGRRPRYVSLPGVGDDAFIDLDMAFPIHKRLLLGRRQGAGVTSSVQAAAMSRSIGRAFGRFAFPDAFNEAVGNLVRRVRSKHGNNGAEGRVLVEHVDDILVEAPWDDAEYEATLLIVLKPGLLAMSDGPPSPASWVAAKPMSIDVICRRLLDPKATPDDRSFLWLALAEEWRKLCMPVAEVRAINVEAIPADELSHLRAREAQPLDFDYLSASVAS
jgi:hypothetical protein